MNRVTVNREDNCISYALKRIGVNMMSYNDIMTGDKFSILNYVPEKLIKGDLVIWVKLNDINKSFIQNEITESGMLLSNKYDKTSFHFGVYEGDGLISDINIDQDHDRSIIIRKVRDLDKLPRYIARINI